MWHSSLLLSLCHFYYVVLPSKQMISQILERLIFPFGVSDRIWYKRHLRTDLNDRVWRICRFEEIQKERDGITFVNQMSISFDPLLTSSGSNTSSSSDENVSSSLETGEFCLFTFISTLDESRASLTPPRTASHNSPTTSCSCYYENILTLLNDSDMKTDIDLFLNENHTQPNSRSRGDEGEEAHSHVDPKTNFNLSDEEDRTRCKVRHGSSDDETSIRRCIERKGHALLLRSLEKGGKNPIY